MSFKQNLFRSIFDENEVATFRASYENINPDRPPETLSTSFQETEPAFRSFVKDTSESNAFVDEFLPKLGMFLQGPFPLPGNRVVKSAWDCRGKINAYNACGLNQNTLKGKRIIDIGCNAGYDTFYYNALGALESVGLEPWVFYYHSMFLSAVYDRPGVSFYKVGWENINPAYIGKFDIVACNGLIYHVKNPMQLIDKITSIIKPNGQLIMETHVLLDSSMQAYFVENNFWGDETYWWIFGDECLTAMLRSSGFKDVQVKLKMPCDSRNPNDPKKTIEGIPAGARAWFTATKR